MALLGTFIDVRTIATIATSGSATFAHGLGAAPSFVFAQPRAAAVGSSGSMPTYAVAFDAINVTVFNVGAAAGAQIDSINVISIVAHSIIR